MANSSSTLVDIKTFKAEVAERLAELLKLLFPTRPICRVRDGYRIGNKGSLSVTHEGVFHDFESGKGGDVIALVEHALHMNFTSALHYLRVLMGKPPTESYISPSRAAKPKASNLSRIQKAQLIWQESSADLGVGALYLRYRGIHTWPEGVLRLHPGLWNFSSKSEHPALIAPIISPDGSMTAVHAIFLTDDGAKISGDGVKAKLVFGQVCSGAIRLAEATDRLALCEGLEDGLSIAQSTDEWPVWVTGGTSNLRSVQVPESVQEVMICADNDSAGTQATRDLSTRLLREGTQVRIATPPDGVKDFNELLRLGGNHG